MIAKQTLFLNGDRTKVVVEGDAEARFLLVREGHEISEAEVEKYDAAELVNTKGKPPKAAEPSEHESMPDRPTPKKKARK